MIGSGSLPLIKCVSLQSRLINLEEASYEVESLFAQNSCNQTRAADLLPPRNWVLMLRQRKIEDKWFKHLAQNYRILSSRSCNVEASTGTEEYQ